MSALLNLLQIAGFAALAFVAWNHTKRLRHLRANCFLTDERGVRVRYAAASEAVRARAEGQG